MKITFTASFTQTMLAWGAILFPEGYDADPDVRQGMTECLMWGADYLMAGHKQEPGKEMIFQVKQQKYYSKTIKKCLYHFY